MKIKLHLFSLMAALILMTAGVSQANNLQIVYTSNTTTSVTFHIRWDNSWYANTAPSNYDAVWVFVKDLDCNNTLTNLFGFSHVNVSSASVTNDSLSMQADVASDNRGAFIHRTAAAGYVNTASCTVTLNFASAIPSGIAVQVYGIEMVYIPQGNNTVGDGTAANSYSQYTIATQGALTNGNLGGGVPTTAGVQANFPEGYNAFYSMKYEVTSEQYVNFLNTLTYDQQATFINVAPNSSNNTCAFTCYARNSIKIKTQGNATTTPKNPAIFGNDLSGTTFNSAMDNVYNGNFDGQNVAENFMNVNDLFAFLSWAALRPMTDLEFEKVCRGGLGRWPNEYVWGDNISYTPRTPLSSSTYGSTSEIPNTAGGNGAVIMGGNSAYCSSTNNGNSTAGPARVGSNATNSSTRVTAGAAYFGVLDMAGNVWEQVISTYTGSNTIASPFSLSDIGTGDPASIPANWTSANTYCYAKGGGWYSTAAYAYTSDRSYYTTRGFTGGSYTTRNCDQGGRGVR